MPLARATGETPAARLVEEQARLQPLATAPADYWLKIPVTVGETAMVSHQGVRYTLTENCADPEI